MEMRTALVTGATSFIGAALIRRLLEEGVTVYAVVRPYSMRESAVPRHPLVTVVPCDMQKMERLPTLIRTTVDAVFHIGWMGNERRENRFQYELQVDNIRASMHVAEAAKALRAKVFVGLGSQAEFGHVEGIMHIDQPERPVSGYGVAKLAAGQLTGLMCQEAGIRHVWARLITAYGPGDRDGTLISQLIAAVSKRARLAVTKGNQIWDYIYVDDVARALYAMALHGVGGRRYVLGSGIARPLREYMEIVRDAIDPTVPLGFGERPYIADQAMHLEADIEPLIQAGALGAKAFMVHSGIDDFPAATERELRDFVAKQAADFKVPEAREMIRRGMLWASK